eukprot:IDg20273t1
MLIGLYGALCSGRTTVAEYLVREHGFNMVQTAADLLGNDALWRKETRMVISHIDANCEHVRALVSRPYFLLVHITASLLQRHDRALASKIVRMDSSLRTFVKQHGDGNLSRTWLARHARASVSNDYSTITQ